MVKALFFDIDGTLVSFNTHTIPQSTIKALENAKTNGAEIYISTGRPRMIINNIGPIEHLIDGYITTNGAYCFTSDTTISCSPIPAKDAAAVVNMAERMGFPCMVVGENALTMHNTESDPQKVQDILSLLNISDIAMECPVQEILKQKILQLTPFITETQEREIISKLSGIESGRWCPEFADFTARGVSKAKGLKDIACYRGFTPADTMAFGDGGNDLSIIRASGIGVAMGNANSILKQASDYITTSVDDNGVYNALKHFGVI